MTMQNLANLAEVVGRVLFALIFLQSVPGHLSGSSVEYAAKAGVPMANLLVPFAGLLAGLGGLSVALGFHARYGALLLLGFLLPVTFMMHAYWAIDDPAARQTQYLSFVKNMSLVGGALFVLARGTGPWSLAGGSPANPPVLPRWGSRSSTAAEQA